MKNALFCFVFALTAHAQLPAPWTFYPFAPAAGKSGTTAIHKDDACFIAWADGYTALTYGSNVDDTWKTPAKALGKAVGDSYDIVCLGRGGTITLTFSTPIANGAGNDFAVFENSFSDTFLELAWVEVSSDGIHFCRFPNYYGGTNSIGAFGSHAPTLIYGLASKYRQGYGTPFDLHELQNTYDGITNKSATFLSAAYATAFTNNFPYIDLNHIGYMRFIDIVGDGSAKEATGRTIYDPYPTVGSAGFDLDAVGVIHQRQTVSLLPQTIAFAKIPHQRLATGSIALSASSDSGLPVSFTVTEGPATLTGSTLTFTGNGTVVITASQPGDSTYAPAANVVCSFVVAETLQHLYLAPVPNLCEDQSFSLYAQSSQGLPVSIEVMDGDAIISASNVLTIGHAGFAGANQKFITVRAFQAGSTTIAPAEDVYATVNVVAAGTAHTPQTFAAWCAAQNISPAAQSDADADGYNAFEEFMAGTNPLLSTEKPRRAVRFETDNRNDGWCTLSLRIRRRALATLTASRCLTLGAPWTPCVPRIQSIVYAENDGVDFIDIELAFPAENEYGFFRLNFSE